MSADANIWFSGLGGALVGGLASFIATFIAALMNASSSRKQISHLREQVGLHKIQIEQARAEFEAFKSDREKLSKSRLIDLDGLLEEICEDLIEFSGLTEIDDREVEVLGTRKSLQEAGSIRAFLSEVKIECGDQTYEYARNFMRSCIELVDDCKSFVASSKPTSERTEILDSVASALKIGETARRMLAPRVA